MKDPKLQAIWHDLNEAQISIIHSTEEKKKSDRLTLLVEAERLTRQANQKLKNLLADRLRLEP